MITAHRVPVDLGRLVERTFADLRIERPVEVQTRPCPLRADAAQVERIVENLLANAVKYTDPETPIWVRVEPTEDGALVTVEDAGSGVPEGSHERIFEPFERAHDQRHAPGTGVGLALVARIAQMHDGEAWVEDRPGGGASFKVSPRDPAPDHATPVAERRRAATATPQSASARAPQQLEPVGERTRLSWVEVG